MPRANPHQAELPRFEPGSGVARAHVADCGCPQCLGWARELADRRAAEAALARRRARSRAKALARQLELAEEERRTAEYLRRQAEAALRVDGDPRLQALLASRRQGKPVSEALAEVERRFGERRAG
jgi:hypothetical protein